MKPLSTPIVENVMQGSMVRVSGRDTNVAGVAPRMRGRTHDDSVVRNDRGETKNRVVCLMRNLGKPISASKLIAMAMENSVNK